jgi:hypothetical protein
MLDKNENTYYIIAFKEKFAISDNTKPFARMGRKAYRVLKDSRVAEISKNISAARFFVLRNMMFGDLYHFLFSWHCL